MTSREQEHLIQSVVAVRKSTGVLYVSGEPVYLFEHMMYNNLEESDFVACFDIDKVLYEKSDSMVIDKAKMLVQPSMYSESSLLGRIGNAIKKSKNEKDRYVYKPALYVSEVMSGVGSLDSTTKTGMGFYEYMPDTIDHIQGKLVRGDKTGVFILLDNVHWDEPVLDLQSIQRSLSDGSGDWHEL